MLFPPTRATSPPPLRRAARVGGLDHGPRTCEHAGRGTDHLMSPGSRRLGVPRPATVQAGPGGGPGAVDHPEGVPLRGSWAIEDPWGADRPLRRRPWGVVAPPGPAPLLFP